MDMEDPWGSPWADEVHQQAPSKPRDDVEVRPVTPTRALPVAEKVGINSPWNDENDGFGDWAAGPDEREIGMKGNSHSEDGWGRKDISGDPKPPEGLNGLLPSWDDVPEIPIGGSPSLLFPPADIVRQNSPDPWATEAPSNATGNEEEQGKETSIGELADTIFEDRHVVDIVEKSPSSQRDGNEFPKDGHNLPHIIGLEDDKPDKETPNSDSDGRNLSHILVGHDVEKTCSQDIDPDNGEIGLDDVASLETIEVNKSPIEGRDHVVGLPAADHESSRPSTSPSDHSHHDEQALPESPRTSLDEEQGRPQTGRKVSSKVQELVQHFDGIIAKQNAVVEPISGTPQKPTREDLKMDDSEEVAEEEDDFGDFEEGMSDMDEASEKPAPFDKAAVIQGTSISFNTTTFAPKKEYGPVDFDLDISTINKLYSDLEPDPAAEKIFIPETIIHDSFHSVEQRKTWYRISRYGSMRKHNTGDDENYKRVNWSKSHMRDEVLKIVGRWLEEDRLSGRVVLGGASKGSSIFGWNDSSQAPLPVSSALAAKRGRKKSQIGVDIVAEVPREWPKMSSRRSSPRGHGRRRSSAKAVSHPGETKVDPEVPVANFEWNTPSIGDVGAKVPIQEKPVSKPKSSSRSDSPLRRSGSTSRSSLSKRVLRPKDSEGLAHLQQQAIKPKVAKEIEPPLPAASVASSSFPQASMKILPPTVSSSLGSHSVSIDEDDDWGEMVSSPTVAPVPTFPTPKLRHKKSISLSGSSSIGFFNTSIPGPQDTPFQRGHKSTASLDGILVPEPISSGPSSNVFFMEPMSSDQAPPPNTQLTISNPTVPITSSPNDPWASADFSFFDSAPASTPVPPPSATPRSSATPAKAVSFAGNPIHTTTAPVRERRNQRSREEMEQDRIVKSIVDALPDLSYMLR